MKTTGIQAALIAAMMSAAAPVFCEIIPAITQDPLMRVIMSRQLTLPGGGVTGSTRLGSGEAIPLSLIDPLAPLAPAAGLVAKPVKEKARRKVRSPAEQLRKLSSDERRADWSGRK